MSLKELPSYANLNADDLAAKIGLNVKHIPILIQSFTQESATILENLQKAITEKDYEQIAQHAHSIKGSAGNLKFDDVYELAKEVEASANDKNDSFPYSEAYELLNTSIKSISL